ncbi:MAG TPA: cyclic nucleotide-binding domain-containing protein [Rariglobus sp.]|jgi:CRP-like cAMP-binding protein|nr:cyclic nucleotide-binding domain-containing protein [Rariglobus sp.]
MDENLLLTAETLVLSPDLQKSRFSDGGFVLKNIPTQTYLRVNEMQWAILRMFETPRTVPHCLEASIQNRSCIPLREFYELILKAQRAFVLHSRKAIPIPRKASHWSLVLPVLPVFVIGMLSVAVAVGALLTFRPVFVEKDWLHWLAGWALWGAALSLGNVMAASVLARMEGDVYHPRFLWRRPVPYFEMDLADACLQPRWVRTALEFAKYMPLAAITAVSVYLGQGWALPLVAGFFVAMRPLGGGLPGRVFSLLHTRMPLDTGHAFVFSLNRRPSVYWAAWWKGIDWRMLGVELAYAAGWTVLVTWEVLQIAEVSFREVLLDWRYWMQCLPWIGAAILLMLVYILGRQLSDVLLEKLRQVRRQLSIAWGRWRTEAKFPDHEGALLKLAGSNVLLGQLSLYDQAGIAREFRPVLFKARKTLIEFQQAPDRVGLILSGKAAVFAQSKSGRKVPLVQLAEGDLFGAHAMVDSVHPSLEVRSVTPLAVMMIPAQVFKRVVIDKMGAALVYDLTHKHAFLQRLPLCTHWYGHALGRFARLSKVVDFKEGEQIVTAKSDARAFFIVYEGRALVMRNGRKVGLLNPGDYFGEIGLLQNSSAVADVLAMTDMRCLQIGKAEFLRFVAHNHHVALQLERVSSKRLRHPIFPMEPTSFNER